MKYWTINKVTREVIGSGEADKWNMPRNVLLIEPLPPKEDFAVIATTDLKGTEYVADHRGKIIYNKDNLHESKQVEDLGEIEDSWTLEQPTTDFDEWIDGAWVLSNLKAFNGEIEAINIEYDRSMTLLANEYNVAIARDGSVETEKVLTVRTKISDLDSKYEIDQLAIITKYFGG